MDAGSSPIVCEGGYSIEFRVFKFRVAGMFYLTRARLLHVLSTPVEHRRDALLVERDNQRRQREAPQPDTPPAQ